MSQMLWVGESLVRLGRCRTLQEVLDGVSKVGPEDLRRVAGEIFKNRSLNLAVIGPRIEELEKDFRGALAFSRG
jgi:predicted Zn-dependent peptidase